MRIIRSAMACMAAFAFSMISTPAVADPAEYGAEFRLKVTTASNFSYETTLTCMPTGGGHSFPAMACNVLKMADGKFDHIQPQEWQVCTKEYKPIRLAALGHWRGEKVKWAKVYGNECEAHRNTDEVFNW